MEWGLGELPQFKFESLLEMRSDADCNYIEKSDVKEIMVELVMRDLD